MARPLKIIDGEKVKELASKGNTISEIAADLDCSEALLYRRFASDIEKGRNRMKASLRRRQYEVADKGNVTMLIWLGKQELGQTDKSQIEETTRDVTFGNLRVPSFQSNQSGSTDKPN